MADAQGKNITLKVVNDEIRFKVDMLAFNSFQNEMMPDNKVAPANNFLMRTVHPEDKKVLEGYLDQGYAIDIAGFVSTEFKPALEISVKE